MCCSLGESSFHPLGRSEEEDEQIEVLRRRKERVYTLEKCFEAAEKAEKRKFKERTGEKVRGNFTTNYQGEKIEIKPQQHRRGEPFLTIPIHAKLTDEREVKQVRDLSHLPDEERDSNSKRVDIEMREGRGRGRGSVDSLSKEGDKGGREVGSFTLREI